METVTNEVYSTLRMGLSYVLQPFLAVLDILFDSFDSHDATLTFPSSVTFTIAQGLYALYTRSWTSLYAADEGTESSLTTFLSAMNSEVRYPSPSSLYGSAHHWIPI